jgi:hypothetical protein
MQTESKNFSYFMSLPQNSQNPFLRRAAGLLQCTNPEQAAASF